jgi:hypothetical protein
MAEIYKAFDLKQNALDTVKMFFAGIECEIESVRSKKDFEVFAATHDGSLRNEGVEFISIPLTKDHLVESFKNLHAHLEYYNKEEAFTSRTSTHVHINCRTLTEQQTRQLILFYALFEEFFFAMVNHDRRANIHCVPLTETFLPTIYGSNLTRLTNNWHKYTALNILPLRTQGSIEFRHLQGTDDAVLLNEWVSTLNNLWILCQREEITAEGLSTPDQIRSWWRELFKDSPRILALEPALHNMMQNNLLDVKFAFV